jgi:hypothetical protein
MRDAHPLSPSRARLNDENLLPPSLLRFAPGTILPSCNGPLFYLKH